MNLNEKDPVAWTGKDWFDHLTQVIEEKRKNINCLIPSEFTLNARDFDNLFEYVYKLQRDIKAEEFKLDGIRIVKENRLSLGECWGRYK